MSEPLYFVTILAENLLTLVRLMSSHELVMPMIAQFFSYKML